MRHAAALVRLCVYLTLNIFSILFGADISSAITQISFFIVTILQTFIQNFDEVVCQELDQWLIIQTIVFTIWPVFP